MIEIRHLKLIDTVAKVGTLKKAAESLFLTQSALSHQLRELETYLGHPIFHRVKNQLVFTTAGKVFREACGEILDKLEHVESRIHELNKESLKSYVHGYSPEEAKRLNAQANSIAEVLHWDSIWDPDSSVLEAGCGVGAQTSILANQNPEVKFTSVDVSEDSLRQAKTKIDDMNLTNVTFQTADVRNLPYRDNHFDHVFVCFLLEHLSNPQEVLTELMRVLKPNGSIMVIEGDHGSTYFYPDSKAARNAVEAQIKLQRNNGGDPTIGRKLYPLLESCHFNETMVSPRQVYVDGSKPGLAESFIKNTFTAMIQGIANEAIAQKIIPHDEISKGIEDLLKTMEGGTFCYTFFKAISYKI